MYSGGSPRELLHILRYAHLYSDFDKGTISMNALNEGIKKLSVQYSRCLSGKDLQALKEIKDKLDLKVEHVVNEGISINHTAFNNTFSRTSALARDYHNRLIDTLAKEPAKRDTVFSKSLRNGNYIYQSKLGICEVQEVSDIDTTTGSCLLLLSRPGFEWDKEKKEFLDSTPANRRFRKNIVVKF